MPTPADRMHRVRVIAREEYRRALETRWLFLFTILFALLVLGLSFFGLAQSREVGFQGFARVTLSLMNLVLIIVPLAALLLGVTSLAGAASRSRCCSPSRSRAARCWRASSSGSGPRSPWRRRWASAAAGSWWPERRNRAGSGLLRAHAALARARLALALRRARHGGDVARPAEGDVGRAPALAPDGRGLRPRGARRDRDPPRPAARRPCCSRRCSSTRWTWCGCSRRWRWARARCSGPPRRCWWDSSARPVARPSAFWSSSSRRRHRSGSPLASSTRATGDGSARALGRRSLPPPLHARHRRRDRRGAGSGRYTRRDGSPIRRRSTGRS